MRVGCVDGVEDDDAFTWCQETISMDHGDMFVTRRPSVSACTHTCTRSPTCTHARVRSRAVAAAAAVAAADAGGWSWARGGGAASGGGAREGGSGVVGQKEQEKGEAADVAGA